VGRAAVAEKLVKGDEAPHLLALAEKVRGKKKAGAAK